jgi:16S rRNA (cytosine1402-N4)-methyltransferase
LNKLHISVLLKEILEILDPKPFNTYIDGTLGLAGHSLAILEKVNSSDIQLIGLDRDPKSLDLAKELLKPYPEQIDLINTRFSALPDLDRENKLKLKYKLGGILLDLGISSWQLKEAGLSFLNPKIPLDMRLDPWCKLNASEIVNEWTEKKLADLFWDLADYKPARRLAKLIVKNRPIKDMEHLVDLCKEISGGTNSKIHSATLPLMALRIAVNEELSELEQGLKKIIDWMQPESKLLVISFHSGEDRIVKNIFREFYKAGKINLLTEKPLIPSDLEIKQNPRSRSAKLRVLIKKTVSDLY